MATDVNPSDGYENFISASSNEDGLHKTVNQNALNSLVSRAKTANISKRSNGQYESKEFVENGSWPGGNTKREVSEHKAEMSISSVREINDNVSYDKKSTEIKHQNRTPNVDIWDEKQIVKNDIYKDQTTENNDTIKTMAKQEITQKETKHDTFVLMPNSPFGHRTRTSVNYPGEFFQSPVEVAPELSPDPAGLEQELSALHGEYLSKMTGQK